MADLTGAAGLRLGDTEIGRAYLGDTLVFSSAPTVFSVVYNMASSSPSSVDDGITASVLVSNGLHAEPIYSDQSGVYSGNPAVAMRTLSTLETNVSGNLAATITGDAIRLTSVQFRATRGGSSTPRGLIVRVSVDGGAPVEIYSQRLATVRPTMTTVDLPLTDLPAGDTYVVRLYPFAPNNSATVDVDDLELTFEG